MVITKTNYLAFLQCPKRFYLELFEPHRDAPPDEATLRRMRMGSEVDKVARERFAGGVLVPFRPKPIDMAQFTQQAIADGATTLFQATFVVDGLTIKADVLQRLEDGWQLIEVKSATKRKHEHLPDVAFQQFVLEQAGLMVRQVSLMLIDRACRAPDLSNLFAQVDVTADSAEWQTKVREDVGMMRQLIAQAAEPEQPIGKHCSKPFACSFIDHCWAHVDGLTIFDIPRLSGKRETALLERGVLHLHEVPADADLTANQRAFVTRHVEGKRRVDMAGISAGMDSLHFPIHFFDFETIDHAIPQFDGTIPYQQVPFQYSCHILEQDGSLSHRGFLHANNSDPRQMLITRLLRDVGESGSVVVYHAPFERGVLRDLAEAFPAYAEPLHSIIERLWDQLEIFRKHYDDPRFGRSNSLKNVLPVIVPELHYDALAVQNGADAQVVWERIVELGDSAENSAEKQRLIDHLLEYCKLDTYAMVAIHRQLATLIE